VSHLIKAIKIIARAAVPQLSCWNVAGAKSKWYSPDWRTGHGLAVFSYKEEFERLWGLDDEAYEEGGIGPILQGLNDWAEKNENKTLTIVIVWDGMPDSGPDSSSAHSFVGPYDWALALSWRIYGFGGANNENLRQIKLRVLIFDVRTEKGRSSFAARLIASRLNNLLPWIRGYQVNDMEKFAEDLLKLSALETTNGGDDRTRDDVGLTRDLWYRALLKVEDRHSVANQLAPWFLAEGFLNFIEDEEKKPSVNEIIGQSSVRRALHSILLHSGFLKENEEFDGDRVVQEIKKICPEQVVFERRRKVKFMLVDDHCNLGYDKVLELLLCCCHDHDRCEHCLKCSDSLESIYGQLRKYQGLQCEYADDDSDRREKWWKQPRRLFEGECDVLFLDLRFWDNDAGRQEIMKELVQYAEALHVDECTDEDIQVALKAAQAARDGRSGFPLEALTLLPLLLSQLDRTFPIILFSSSHQRAVSEALRNRRNIITSFAKPMISGYGEKIPMTRSIYNLAHAVNKALDLHEARIVWERICAWHTKVQEKGGQLSVTGDVRWRWGRPSNQQPPRWHPPRWYHPRWKGRRNVPPNVPPAQNVPPDFCVSDPIPFNFTEEDCLHLAYLFETYIVGELFYESMHCCWTFLERDIRKNAAPEDVEGRLHIDYDAGFLASLLRMFRDKTSHGNWGRDSFQVGGQNQVRRVALLLFLYLLGYLQRQNAPANGPHYELPCYYNGESEVLNCIGKKMIFYQNGIAIASDGFNMLDNDVQEATFRLLDAYVNDVDSRCVHVANIPCNLVDIEQELRQLFGRTPELEDLGAVSQVKLIRDGQEALVLMQNRLEENQETLWEGQYARVSRALPTPRLE